MVKQGMYWKDENGNMWHEDRYSEMEAAEASATLIDSHGCLNCEVMLRCSFCTDSRASVDCLDCINVECCQRCRWSENCVSCVECESCVNLVHGYGQKMVCLTPTEYSDAMLRETNCPADDFDEGDYEYADDYDYDYDDDEVDDDYEADAAYLYAMDCDTEEGEAI